MPFFFSILVSATDADSGENGEITFSVENTDAFEMETVPPSQGGEVYVGRVKVKK